MPSKQRLRLSVRWSRRSCRGADKREEGLAPHKHLVKVQHEATERAKQRLLVLINLGPFELVRTGRDEDIYGRKLRVIQRGGRSLGDVLVAEGLARPWDGARRGWCGSASAALSPVASALERFPIGRNELLALIAGVLVAAAALLAVPVWRWRIRKSTIERDFKNVFAFTSSEGKEALIKSWVDRKKCSRLEAMRLAVEEWRHDANRW